MATCSYLVIKVSSRCNLNCTYCYMYNLGDMTYKNQPKVMSDEVADAVIQKAAAHAYERKLKKFQMSFHGGEPLLAGMNFFENFIRKARNVFSSYNIPLNFSIQTNGILLNQEWCDFFNEHKVAIGISLDGNETTNDKNRVYHNGKGSYKDVVKGIKALQHSGHNLSGGILTVIDLETDPADLYRHFKELDIVYLDLLFPDSNYAHPYLEYQWATSTAYADWLIRFYDAWYYDTDQYRPKIRLFENISHGIVGRYQSSDFLGNHENQVLVIETDGNIEPVDVLKICGDGFTKQGVNVLTHSIEDSFSKDLIKLYNQSHLVLHEKCQRCPVQNICGGGYLPHRYSNENEFDNPSIYCRDLMKIINHIRNRVVEKISTYVDGEVPYKQMSFEELEECF
ncbi:radical SAM protein [Chitinophaga flava]|uniref:Radical SAM core domain-containing protein n=1 Tax=Chitinophaga flava TaxID=2259036 RepID=A0A365XU50_9BACT|nr:radical SAM protein [Chitinophaga flava]RBL89648.1 hypothetical protein DF182_24415 [Chitinophaga flava]